MLRSLIYDTLIPGMTARWYAAVLERIPEQARVLDVGIGTAGALLANTQTVLKRDLGIVGIDIDADYVRRAQTRLAQSPIRDAVSVRQESVYDHQGGPYDAIYFSASFMLLPEPEQALRHCRSLLAPDGRIYFTQTIQLQRSPLMERLKPMIKRLTSIDFGQVTYEADFKACISAAGLSLSEFCVLDRHGGRASCLAVASAATDLSARDE